MQRGAYLPPGAQYDLGGPRSAPATWLEKQRGNKRSKMFLVGGIVGLLLVIAIAIGVGVSLGTKHKPVNNLSTSGNNTSSSNGNNTATSSDPNDPSKFTKDPKLLNSFYGFAYTPEVRSIRSWFELKLIFLVLYRVPFPRLARRHRLISSPMSSSCLN